MTVSLSLLAGAGWQFFDDNGNPLSGGLLYTYEAGTTTPQTTYTDSNGNVANANPIVLDAAGRVPYQVWLTSQASYKFILKTSTGVTVWSEDDVPAEVDFATLAASSGSSLIGFLQAGTGAVVRTAQSKMRETVSVKDFGAVGNGVANDAAAIQAAIDKCKSDAGGAVAFDGSAYASASTVTVKGEISRGLVLNGDSSRISFSHAGTGFLFGEFATPGSEFRLKTKAFNLNLTGPGKATASSVAVKVDETADVFAQGGIWSGAEKGLWLNGGLICDFSEQVIRDCATGIVANSTVNFAPNSVNFTGVRVIKNDLAVNYDDNPNGVTNWYGCEIEANNESGTTTDGKVVTNLTKAGHHNFIGCHFESNKGQTSIKFTGDTSAKHLMVLGCEIIDSNAGTGLDVNTGRATILSSRITGVTNINFGANARGTLIDVEGTPAGALGNVMGVRDGRLAFGQNPVNTAPLISATPAAIAAASTIVTDWQNDTIQMRWKNSAGTRIAYLQTSASSDHTLNNDNAGGGWAFGAANTTRFYVGRGGGASIEPGSDNSTTCGGGALRWSVVYAATGTINTSDERAKQDIAALDAAEKRVAAAIKGLIKKYRFKDAVQAKGDDARIHVGVIAQEVMAAFQAENLDPMRYGIICYDQWDADGDRPAGDRYGVRYEELLAFIIAAL